MVLTVSLFLPLPLPWSMDPLPPCSPLYMKDIAAMFGTRALAQIRGYYINVMLPIIPANQSDACSTSAVNAAQNSIKAALGVPANDTNLMVGTG